MYVIRTYSSSKVCSTQNNTTQRDDEVGFVLCTHTHLSTSSDGELLVGSKVVDEETHEPQFLTETHQNEETTGMQSHAVRLLRELLVEVQGAAWR